MSTVGLHVYLLLCYVHISLFMGSSEGFNIAIPSL